MGTTYSLETFNSIAFFEKFLFLFNKCEIGLGNYNKFSKLNVHFYLYKKPTHIKY